MTIACKFCAAELKPESGRDTCECGFCGTVQTIPMDLNDKKISLFNRANRLRMSREYDRASSVYSAIKAEYPNDAEALWGMCLCTYGIEYAKNSETGKYETTCRRITPVSIIESEYFIQVLEFADKDARQLYQGEAEIIDRIQKEYMAVVSAEPPCDVFICCRGTADEDGYRSEDSVIAEEIFHALTEQGLKVFFAREALTGKPEPHEPYIYSALSSARVMLVIGTCFESFDDIKVKDNWGQFLAMRRIDKQKGLILCTKDVDEYDIPPELSKFDRQDMEEQGWLQELIEKVYERCAKID